MYRSRCLQWCQNHHAKQLVRFPLKVLFVGLLTATGCTPTSIALAPTAQAQQVPIVATSTPSLAPSTAPVVQDSILSNCYLFVLSQIPSLPMASEIVSNTTPHVGAVAFFQYGKLPHYAIITSLEATGFWVKDSNFGGPGIHTHFILWSNPHLKGFWGV